MKFFSCEEAYRICDKAQYNEASFWELMKLKLYILVCKDNAKHSRKNTQLTKLCQKAQLQGLKDEEKELMKKELQKKL